MARQVRVGRREQRAAQLPRHAFQPDDARRGLQVGHHAADEPPGRDGVPDAGGHPQVVLQHEPVVGPVAHEVDARHPDAHGIGGREGALPVPAGRVVDDRRGDHAVGDDLPGAVDVAEERLERPHPLREPGGEARPVFRGDDARHEVEREQPVGGAVADPERDAARALLGAQGRLGRGQPAVAHAAERAEHPAVLGPHLAVGRDRLVVAVGVVGREEIGPHGHGVGRLEHGVAPLGAGDQRVDDVEQLTATAERAALAGGGAARRERGLRQREDLLPVAHLLQVRPQLVHEAADRQLGRDELGLVAFEVDEVALQPRARRAPAARAQQLVAAVGQRAARVEVDTGAGDERAEQARDEHDVLDVRAGVAHPQLHGGQVRARPDVEVDHPGVGDRAGGDQLVDHGVVVGAGLDVPGRARGRPARPHHAAVAGVPGVLARASRASWPRSRAAWGGRARRGARPAPRRPGRARRRAPGRRRCAVPGPAAGTRAACARSARPRRSSSPSRSTSGTVPAATTPSPSGSATDSSVPRSRRRCPRSSSSVAQTGVLVSTSERCSSGANSAPSSWASSASTSGAERRVSRSTT